MSMKVAKSIGFLYKRNCSHPETILKTLYTSLIRPCSSYGIAYIEAWHGTYQNNASKIFLLQKKALTKSVVQLSRGAINNLAYNEHINSYVVWAPVVWGIRIQPTFALVRVIRGD